MIPPEWESGSLGLIENPASLPIYMIIFAILCGVDRSLFNTSLEIGELKQTEEMPGKDDNPWFT
jgi:hypothetical protein